MRELIDVYQRSVFSTDVIQRLLPTHYNDLLYRLQYTLHNCVSIKSICVYVSACARDGVGVATALQYCSCVVQVSAVKPSKRLNMIKKLERKTKTVKIDKKKTLGVIS